MGFHHLMQIGGSGYVNMPQERTFDTLGMASKITSRERAGRQRRRRRSTAWAGIWRGVLGDSGMNSTISAAPLRWRAECEARLPHGSNGHLVFMFGGNDAKEVVGAGVEVPLAESVDNARAILSEAAAWCPTLWISLIPMSETKPYPRLLPGSPEYRFDNRRQAEYTQRYAEVAKELGVPFLDVHTLLMQDPEWEQLTQAGDGSNPNAKGYAKLAALVSSWRAWRAWFDEILFVPGDIMVR